MYYSTMANCLNYAAYIPKHYCSLVGVSIRQNKLACRTPPAVLVVSEQAKQYPGDSKISHVEILAEPIEVFKQLLCSWFI